MDGAKFRAIRKALSLSQDQLAALLDMARPVISRYERDQSPIPTRVALAMTALFYAQPEPTMEQIADGS